MNMRSITGTAVAWILVTGSAWAAKPETLSVQVQKGQLRSTPSYVGSVVGTVQYGDRLTVVETQAPWKKVSTADGAVTGWIHGTALTPKKIVLSSGSKDAQTAASSDEMAMAGKGFNSDVEKQFKDKNKDVDFTWVDRMETFVVSAADMKAFLEGGRVQAGKGGAQ